MTTKRLNRKNLGLLGATVACIILPQATLAAGPVAVAPGQKMEVVVEQPSPSSPVKFSVSLGAGYLTGESKEMVYWPHVGNHKASELTWKIDSLFMVGIGAKLEVRDWFTANFDGWFKATNGDGTMDDYDWMVPGGDWTDWSHHENTDVTDGSILDVNAEFAFYRTPSVKFNGIGGFKRDNFGWEARGGDYVYSVAGYRDTAGSFPNGLQGISYEQTMTSFYFGLGIAVKSEKFHFNSRVIYSPLVTAEATDNHHLRNLVTYEDFDDGDLIAFDIAGSYLFTEDLSLEVAYSYQSYDTMQGDSEWHYNDSGVVITYADAGGMDQQSSLISTSIQYTF